MYWHDDGQVQIAWANETFTNLDDWRGGTGQERVKGLPTGLISAPNLTGHPPGIRAGERIGLSGLRAFRPRADSPVIASGMNLRKSLDLDAGGRDFFGKRLPNSGELPIGAIARTTGP